MLGCRRRGGQTEGVTRTAGPRGAEHCAGGLHPAPTLSEGTPQACLFCGGRDAGSHTPQLATSGAGPQAAWVRGRGWGRGASQDCEGSGQAWESWQEAQSREGERKVPGACRRTCGGEEGGGSIGSGHGFTFFPQCPELRFGAGVFLSPTFCKGGIIVYLLGLGKWDLEWIDLGSSVDKGER